MDAQLNAQQREAVAYTQGPLLLIAGPGSGKTRVITHRIAHIISADLAQPLRVLAVTFTNKAAGEMKSRVLALLEAERLDSMPVVATFHSFCLRLLRRTGGPLAQIRPGFTTKFHVFDTSHQEAVMKDCFNLLRLKEKEFMTHEKVLERISHAKTVEQTPAGLLEKAINEDMVTVARLFDAYEGVLRRENALDFDDLMGETVRLLRNDDSTRRDWNQRLEYIMVDEFQDTNYIQYALIRLLTHRQQNICVVGDDDQGIYSWRGATVENIANFKRDYKDVKLICLEQNYRSTQTIVGTSRKVIERNLSREPKELWTALPAGEPIRFYEGYDADNEARFIAHYILKSCPGNQVAVLYRSNRQSLKIELALQALGLKYKVVSGLSFFQREEIKDVMAYLKVATGNCDSISLLRIINKPARGIGQKTIEEISQFAQEKGIGLLDAIERKVIRTRESARRWEKATIFRNLIAELAAANGSSSLSELIEFIINRTRYKAMLEDDLVQGGKPAQTAQSKLENLKELIEVASASEGRGETAEDFIDYMSLTSDADAYDENALISLMTVHTSKGLEFDLVFICGLEEGVFPTSYAESREDLEEERRVFYVAMTRSKGELVLTRATNRQQFRKNMAPSLVGTLPSRFLYEVRRNPAVIRPSQRAIGE